VSSYNEHRQSRIPFESASVSAIAEALETTEWRLFVWLENARALGISVELFPLLAAAREQLALALPTRVAGTRLKLERLVLTPDGAEPVEVIDALEHARVDRHWEAALLALAGDERPLRRFEGLTVAGVALASTVSHVRAWADPVVRRGQAS
jgi:hypothetical protein